MVEDTGRGISAEQLPYIFEPYSRFYEPGQKIDGVGLGLHIVKTLVKEMDGEVSVKSEVGKGSQFSFALRMMGAEDTKDSIAGENNRIVSEVVEADGLSGMNILVAEDDEDNRELMKLVFEDTGCNMQFAHNGAKALEEMKKKKYDLVLMDLRMPIMDGFQTTKAIRKDIDKSIPILALTAHGMERIEDKCKEAGMNGYITKPLDVEKLKKMIKRFVGTGKSAPDLVTA